MTADDRAQAHVLEQEAFGYQPDAEETFPPLHTSDWGSFGEDGRLLARAAGREHRSWFRGVAVPSTGIADVTVHAEARGGGLVAGVLRGSLSEGGDRGAVISTMYPTAPGIYRAYGYELIGSYDVAELPTHAAALVRAPAEEVTVRRAGAEDFAAVRSVYDAWAARQSGPLDRRMPGPLASETGVLERSSVSLAEDASGTVIGYATWDRGTGYDADTVLSVRDLLGSEPAVRALWRLLGSFSSVAPRLRLKTSPADQARLVLPSGEWRTVETHPYALRVDDVCGAFAHVPVPAALAAGTVPFSVAGDRLGDLDGGYVLTLTPGSAVVCERAGGGDGPVLTPNALAAAWAGVERCDRLRSAGLLSGPTSYDDVLDRLLLAGPLEIRNYF